MQSIVDFSDVNVELGLTSTAQLSASNTGFRNVANDTSGAINMTQVRRGINFPGRTNGVKSSYYTSVTGPTRTFPASANANLDVEAIASVSQAAAANATIAIYSNGSIHHITQTVMDSVTTQTIVTNQTWLTAGAAGDYTANMAITSGAFNGVSSSATGTDLVLSTDRAWTVNSRDATGSGNTRTAVADLIIKQSGTEIFRRPVNVVCYSQGNGAPAPK